MSGCDLNTTNLPSSETPEITITDMILSPVLAVGCGVVMATVVAGFIGLGMLFTTSFTETLKFYGYCFNKTCEGINNFARRLSKKKTNTQ